MWIWRKMLKIDWTQKSQVKKCWSQFKKKGILSTISTSENTSGLACSTRHDAPHNGLLHTNIEGRIEGKRGRGRKGNQMLDDIKEKKKYDNMKRTDEDRTRWSERMIK